jgi:oxygen-independent coproporphyrinogen-3 oxidase
MRPDRVAVYSFAYLPWLKPNQKSIPEEALPNRETKFALFATAIRAFLAAGYHQIGMDHFALPEDEMARAVASRTLYRNFMGYTVHRAPDMLGLGITAIGEVQGAFAQNTRKLSLYSAALRDGRFPVERGYALSDDDKIRQRVILELMCNFYVSTQEISTQFGIDFNQYFRGEIQDLGAKGGPEEEGFVHVSPDVIEVTPLGRLFIRNVAMIFDRYLRDKPRDKPKFSQTV